MESNPSGPATHLPTRDAPAGQAAVALAHDLLAAAVELRRQITTEVARVYIGDDADITLILAAMLAGGHVLLEGVPGLAKTTLAKAVAQCLGCDFRRVQFTPDLLPADITGTYIFNQGSQQFDLRRGPVFAQIVLADEINRAPAKTQAALLEAMQEGQVTIEGQTLPLPSPFLVLATQNPVEQEGVYMLPEAQIDRFLIRLRLDYPSTANELRMLQTYNRALDPVRVVSSGQELLRFAACVEQVHVEERVLSYAVRLAQATREHGRVALGASPRATLGLIRMAKSWALLAGRDYVSPDDLRQLLPVVMTHRVMVTTDSAIEGTTPADVVEDVIRRTRIVDGAAQQSVRRAPTAPGTGEEVSLPAPAFALPVALPQPLTIAARDEDHRDGR